MLRQVNNIISRKNHFLYNIQKTGNATIKLMKIYNNELHFSTIFFAAELKLRLSLYFMSDKVTIMTFNTGLKIYFIVPDFDVC